MRRSTSDFFMAVAAVMLFMGALLLFVAILSVIPVGR